jgi:glycosyltransferase involved in cell wall biosynthesis
MNRVPARIALVCEGDAESHNAFSGTAKKIVDGLRLEGHVVSAVDAELYGMRRLALAACSFNVDREVWRVRYHTGELAFRMRSSRAERRLARLRSPTDVLLAIGAAFAPPGRSQIPYCLYCDWNLALARQELATGQSPVSFMSDQFFARANARERSVYQGAAAIFTISEKLRESFIEHYGIPENRVLAVNAGANFDIDAIPARPSAVAQGHRPTILFVGKQFMRKGGDILLDAFRKVRTIIPDARLLILGAGGLDIVDPGVEVLGYLSKDIPRENERIIECFREADVFCLPTRYDPFPNVVREAMFFRLPCVTTDIWAMPEMVVDGETGFTVPVNDANSVADRLIRILRDPDLARRMGAAGRRRAEERFTWKATVGKMHERIEQVTGRMPS